MAEEKKTKKNKEAAKENKSEDDRLEYGCSIGDMLKAKGQKL